MLTRQEIETIFKVEKGIIKSPGKFEGEMLYVPYFWELDGEGEMLEGGAVLFETTNEDLQQFPELEGQETVVLFQRDDGFVVEVR